MYAEGVSLKMISAEVGTPFYCYSKASIEENFHAFNIALKDLLPTICYSVKANSNLAVIKILANLGAGADVVSLGELRRALVAGIPANKIVFSGVGKTARELDAAVDANILQINVESMDELYLLNRIALGKGKRVNIAIRVNPNVDAKTHKKITTGRSENKFGIDIECALDIFECAHALEGLQIVGIAIHIGSQLMDLSPYREAYKNGIDLVIELRKKGFEVKSIDIGGGLGIAYRNNIEGKKIPLPAQYGQMVKDVLGDVSLDIIAEPGRTIVGNSGILVSTITYLKQGPKRKFLILDAAMNDLIRPTLYNAYHEIETVNEPKVEEKLEYFDVVGPICETGDAFAENRLLPPVSQGDLIAIRGAGAYGAVMSSTYNSRPLIPEVLVSGSSFSIVRHRFEIDDLLRNESIPDWL